MIPTKEQLTLSPSEWNNFINHIDQPMGDEFWAWLNLWDRFTENNPMTCHEEAIVRYGHYRGFMDLFIVEGDQ